MEETIMNFNTPANFDKLDENELRLVINQVARRMMILRATTPDAAFWYGVLMRVNKWLSTTPEVNDEEKELLINPPTAISGRARAMKNMRERSGMQLSACKDIVDAWIKDNIDKVHTSVKASFYTSEKNRKEANVS